MENFYFLLILILCLFNHKYFLPGILNPTDMCCGLSQWTTKIYHIAKTWAAVSLFGKKVLFMTSHWDQASVLHSQSSNSVVLSIPSTHLTSYSRSKGRQLGFYLQIRKSGFWHKTAVYKLLKYFHKSLLSLSFFTCRKKVRLI